MTYLMVPLHSLVNGLRMKNRCRQEEGVTLRPQYLMQSFSTWNLYQFLEDKACNALEFLIYGKGKWLSK